MQIDKNKIYQSHDFNFKNLIKLSDEEKRMIWQWRNDEKIRSWMYNTEIISWENHLKFIEILKRSNDRYYWLIYRENIAIGVFDITRYNPTTYFAEIGYYINPKLHGIGFELLRESFYFCFNIIGITHIYLTVKKDNHRAKLLNQFLGMKYTSDMEMYINGKCVPFYVCDSFTLTDFEGKYNLSRSDYEMYLSNNI